MSIIFGALSGFVNGFFGGGGGMIVVPVLTKFFHLPEKNAHATSIAVILPLTIASSIIYLLKIHVNYINMVVCAIGVISGGIIGAYILKKTSNKIIGCIFCGIMFFAGLKMIF